MSRFLLRDTERRNEATRGKGYVKAEAEFGVILPQAMECLELPETEGARKFFPHLQKEHSIAESLILNF